MRNVDKQEILKLLTDLGAFITDSHIVYTSGRHGPGYINKDAIYTHTSVVSDLGRALAEHFRDQNIEIVIGPALGGIILAQWTGYHLSDVTGKEVLAIYAERGEKTEGFVIKRGYDKLISGKKVLVVEDVLTTGRSARGVIKAVREARGEVAGLGVLCNRGSVTVEDIGGVPELFSLINLKLEESVAERCPLCRQNIPINTDVGRGREFLARKRK